MMGWVEEGVSATGDERMRGWMLDEIDGGIELN